MSQTRRVSTGVPGLDRIIDDLRLGDNVVWQVTISPTIVALSKNMPTRPGKISAIWFICVLDNIHLY